jgi:hypothetical protein
MNNPVPTGVHSETELVSRVTVSPVEAVPRTTISAWAGCETKGARRAIAKPINLNLFTDFPLSNVYMVVQNL